MMNWIYKCECIQVYEIRRRSIEIREDNECINGLENVIGYGG